MFVFLQFPFNNLLFKCLSYLHQSGFRVGKVYTPVKLRVTQLSKQTDERQSEARFIMFIGLNQGFLGVSDSIPRGVRSVHLEDRQLIYLLHIIKKQEEKSH